MGRYLGTLTGLVLTALVYILCLYCWVCTNSVMEEYDGTVIGVY
jgi:hypothetical protein